MKGRAQSVRNPKTAAQVMQRNYFRQLASLAAQLTDDQLHALFPKSVKGMTRRNLLQKQLDACAAISGDVKATDLSLLEGIGNGDKINSPMLSAEILEMGGPDGTTIGFIIGYDDLGNIEKPAEANFIIVAYNVTKGRIGIFNTPYTGTDFNIDVDVKGWGDIGDTVRFYITYAASGENVSMRGFGSIIIKTRAEKKGRNINKNGAITSNGDGDGDGDGNMGINQPNHPNLNGITIGDENGGNSGTTPPRNDERPVSGDGDGGNDDIPTPSFHTDELDY